MNSKFTTLFLLCFALLFAWLAMSPCLRNGFINWDETEYITRNPKIRTLSFESVKAMFSSRDLGMYSPLTALSYAAEYRAAGLNPRVYHATSLLLHLANTALVMLLLRSLFGGTWLPFLAALLFGVHPAHVESVAWAAERKDVLYAFFYLASLTVWCSGRGGWARYFISLFLFACSLLSKPMAVTLPFALLLTDYIRNGKLEKKDFTGKLAFFALAAAFAFLMLAPGGGAPQVAPLKRLVLPFYNLAFYVYTLLWPFNLSAMYVSPPLGRPGLYYFAAAAAAGIFLLWKYFRQDRETAAGALFFALMLLPVLQFFPFGPVLSADRYTYLSSIGIFIVVLAQARRRWPGLPRQGKIAAGALAAVLVITLTVTARLRCAVWQNGLTLWTDTLRKQPAAAPALVNLCGACLEAGLYDEAGLCLERAVRAFPGHDDNYYNLAYLAVRKNDFQAAGKYLLRTLELNPCHAPALNDLGNISLMKGRKSEALRYYQSSAACDSGYEPARLNLRKL